MTTTEESPNITSTPCSFYDDEILSQRLCDVLNDMDTGDIIPDTADMETVLGDHDDAGRGEGPKKFGHNRGWTRNPIYDNAGRGVHDSQDYKMADPETASQYDALGEYEKLVESQKNSPLLLANSLFTDAEMRGEMPSFQIEESPEKPMQELSTGSKMAPVYAEEGITHDAMDAIAHVGLVAVTNDAEKDGGVPEVQQSGCNMSWQAKKQMAKYEHGNGDRKYDDEAVAWGVAKYAEAKGLKQQDVTLEELVNSVEGVVHWCCKDQDFSARSRKSQQVMRALNWNSKWLNLYPNFLDSIKTSFRKHFSVCKSFDVTTEERSSVLCKKKGNKDEGEYLGELSLAMYLGGAVDKEGGLALARRYMAMCEKIGNPMVLWHSFLQINVYLYVRKLVYSQHEEEWKQVCKSHSTEKVWEVRAQEGRAIKNYACVHGVKEDEVDIHDVSESDKGIAGWSKMVTEATKTLPMVEDVEYDPNRRTSKSYRRHTDDDREPAPKRSKNRDGGDGKEDDGEKTSKRDKKEKKDKANKRAKDDESDKEDKGGREKKEKKEKSEKQKANALIKVAEKKAKELLSADAKYKIGWNMVSQAFESGEPKLNFASEKIDIIRAANKHISEQKQKMGDFLGQFKANLMLPAELKSMKKELGDSTYLANLHGVINIYESTEGQEAAKEIQAIIAMAKANGYEWSNDKKKK